MSLVQVERNDVTWRLVVPVVDPVTFQESGDEIVAVRAHVISAGNGRDLLARGAFERKGGRVLLFELPYSDQIEVSRLARITSEIVHAEFPGQKRWLHIDFRRTELRWADGIHLDQRSAVIIAHAIDRALSSLPGPT